MTEIMDVPVRTIAGRDATLADWAGQVLLIVNTASRCGLTPQYAGLEALYARYHDQGFAVLGFPANDFKDQEPGTDEEIAGFCEANYGVSFPLFSKIQVTGPDKHPLYHLLTAAVPDAAPDTTPMRTRLAGHGLPTTDAPEVLWNFEKFLVGRDGEVVARFSPDTVPDAPILVEAIERELFASE